MTTPEQNQSSASPERGYARRLGTFDGTMLVMGGIIGAGIFLNPSIVAQRVATPALTITAWLIGGLIALAGAFCFAELGAREPRAGGGYVYIRQTFGALPAFLYGWTLLLVIATGAIAAVALSFARYAVALTGASHALDIPLAIGAILLLSVINVLGVRPGASTQNVFTLLKLLALVVLIACGLFVTPNVSIANATPLPHIHSLGVAIGVALIPVLFSYGGWQQTNFVAEEMKDPERTLPRSLIFGVIGVVIVYVLSNVVYVRQLGVGGLAASAAPAADVMAATVGPLGARFIAAGITASTFGFLNLVIMATPRVYQAMAADGVFFKRVAALHPRFRTPELALAIQAVWAVVLALSGTYGQLLDYATFGDWIFFGLAAATLFVYRRRDGVAGDDGLGGRDGRGGRPREAGTGTSRGFRTPGYPVVPIFFVLGAFYVVVSSIASNPRNAAMGAGLIALGVPAYALFRRGQGGSGGVGFSDKISGGSGEP
jgi:APA family basic amino acid/polyamine antiporter